MNLGKDLLKSLPKSKYLELLPHLKKEKTQTFATLTLTFLALILFGLFAIQPTLATIAKLQKELKDNQFVNKQLDEKIGNLSSLQQRYNSLERDIQIVVRALPKTPTIPLFIGQVQSIARLHNVAVNNLQTFQVELSQLPKDQRHGSFAFAVEVQGPSENLSQFLATLTSFDRIVTVDTFSLVGTSEKGTEPKLNIRGKVHFKP